MPALSREELFYPIAEEAFKIGFGITKGFADMETELSKSKEESMGNIMMNVMF